MDNASSNACPTSYVRLETEASCKGAASIADRMYGGNVADPTSPAGCYWHTVNDRVFFNTDKGAANSQAQPVCAGDAHARTHTHTRTQAHVRTHKHTYARTNDTRAFARAQARPLSRVA